MFRRWLERKLADPETTIALLRRLLFEMALKQWRRYVIAFALMGVAAAATAAGAYLIGDAINFAYVDKDLNGIITIGVFTALIFTAKGFATYGHAVMLSRIGNRIVAENQRRMFAQLMQQNLAYYSARHSSEFLARLNVGAAAASGVINLLITAIGRDLLSLIGLATVMVIQDPVMSLFALLVVPPALTVLRRLIRRVRGIARRQFTGTAQILEGMQEAIQGIRTVKAFTLETAMQQRLDASIAMLEAESNKWARVANRPSPLMDALGGYVIAAFMIYGGYRVIETGATPGQFFSFLAAFMLAYEPAKRLARLNIDLNTGLVGVRILFEVIDAPPSEPDDQDQPPLVLTAGRVEFDDVDFGYRSNDKVIRNLSFAAEPGQMTALVGPSGGGKSTIVALTMRLYEIDGGAITIDGQNIATVSRSSLRRQIAYVSQDVHLFGGTVRHNIAFGRPDASEAEIVAAAKAAYAHDFITAFPAGYDTPVGEHGLQLSGGQRQRISVARALIKDAPIILLDEPTSALDSESERQVQRALDHLCKGRTTIVIAHRLHTVAHADCIYVVEDGSVVESGRHEELLRKDRRYASFYRIQFKTTAEPAQPSAVANKP